MNGFTPKVLDLVTAIVWGAAWHAANSVASSTHEFFRHLANDAVDDDKQINTAVLNLKRKRIMPNEVVDRIKWMAWDSAWGASNDRLGSGGAASWDKRDDHYNALVQSGALSVDLVNRLKDFAASAAWHAINSRAGELRYRHDARQCRDDARKDIMNCNTLVLEMGAEVDVDWTKPPVHRIERVQGYPAASGGSTGKTSYRLKYYVGMTSNEKFSIDTKTNILNTVDLSLDKYIKANYSHSDVREKLASTARSITTNSWTELDYVVEVGFDKPCYFYQVHTTFFLTEPGEIVELWSGAEQFSHRL